MNAPARFYSLNARQEAFARHFALRGSIRHAYQDAFPEEHASNAAAYKAGRELLQSEGVKARARALRDEMALDVQQVTRRIAAHLLDVLEAPRDVVQHRRGACRYCHGDGHRYQWRENEYLDRLDEVEHANRVRGSDMRLPDPAGGFGYDEAAQPHPDCPNCLGRGVGFTYVKDTTELAPDEEAAFEGVEVTEKGIKAKYAAKGEAVAALMKLYGLGADNLRVLFRDTTPEKPNVPEDPREAANYYRDFLAGRLTGPSKEA